MLGVFTVLVSLVSFSEPCTSPILAHKTQRENCWARFDLNPNHQICIHRTLWYQWLRSKQPGPICIDSQAKWSISAVPQNSQLHPITKKVRHTLKLEHLKSPPSSSRIYFLLQKIERWRERTSGLLTPHDPSGILRSLILREMTPDSPSNLLRILGFVHLVSTSGIHLIAISQAWDTVIRTLAFLLRLPIRYGLWISRMSTFLICFIVWLLSGAPAGMLRPWLILIVRGLSQYFGFRWSKGAPLFLALFFDLAAATFRRWQGETPHLYTGRWVYALAVGGGLLWRDCFSYAHLGLAVGSWLPVAVWDIWHTGLVSVATPLVSLLTLPFFCLSVYPLILISLALDALGFSSLAQALCGFVSSTAYLFLEKLSQLTLLPGNVWSVHPSVLLPAFFMSSLFIGLFLGLFPGRLLGLDPGIQNSRRLWETSRIKKYRVVAMIVILLLLLALRFTPSNLKISKTPLLASQIEQLDVGQGDSALVKDLQNQVGLIDTGSAKTLSADQWLQLLSERRIYKISWVGLTHLDEDHSGGLLHLIRIIPIGCIATPRREINSERGKIFQKRLAAFGLFLQDWNSSCIPFPHFAIQPLSSRSSHQHQNENMGVIWIPLQSGGFYLSAGDANAKEEPRIAKWVQAQIQSYPSFSIQNHSRRILKVSHHGSRFSSSALFLNKIRPTEAWISVGVKNPYGHPTFETLSKLQQYRIPIRRTDQEGYLSSQVVPQVLNRTMKKEVFLHPQQK